MATKKSTKKKTVAAASPQIVEESQVQEKKAVTVLAAAVPLTASKSGADCSVNGRGSFRSTRPAVLVNGVLSLEVICKIQKPLSQGDYGIIGMVDDNGVGTYIKVTNTGLKVSYKGNEVQHPISLNIDTLYHLVLTPTQLYINGQAVKSLSTGTAGNPSLFIIGSSDANTNSFPGILGQVRIFTKALTASEVLSLWNNGNPRGFTIPSSGDLRTYLNAEYVASNLYALDGNRITRWVETSNSAKNLDTYVANPIVIYQVGEVDGYRRLAFPWSSIAEEGNLYVFMNPYMHSQTCIIGSDENIFTNTRSRTLTFKTNHIGLVEGAQSSAELEVIQEEAVYTYAFNLRSSVTGKLSAGGGSTTLSTLLITYRNGVQVSSEVVDSTLSIPTTAGFSLSGKTLTAANRGTTVGADRSVEVTARFTTPTGEQVIDSLAIVQEANSATYDNPVVSLSYPTIPASGGTVKPGNASWIQKVTYTSGSTQNLSDVGTASYSGTGVNASTGAVTASSKGTTISGITTVTTSTLSVVANGKTGSKSTTVSQAANSATYGDLVGGSATASDIPASGGTRTATITNATQTVTFTSGSSRPGTVTNSQTAAISGSNLGTTVKARTKLGTITTTFTGEGSKTKQISTDVYQQANTETLNGLLITAPNKDNVSYTGGVVTWSATGTYKYTSGSNQTKTVPVSAGTWSVTGTGATQSSNKTTWAKNLSEASRTATVKFVVSGVTGTGTTTQLSQDLVMAQYSNIVSTYNNQKAGFKKS